MAVFRVYVDVVLSGDFSISASSKEEAIEEITKRHLDGYATKHFYHTGTTVIDIEEE